MIAVLDENLAKQIATALRALGKQAIHVTEPEGPGRGTDDLALFRWLGGKGSEWCLITQDIAQTRRVAEYQAMRSHRLAVFVIEQKRHGPLTVFECGTLLINMWPQIEVEMRKTNRPLVMTLSKGQRSLRPLRP